MRTNSRQWGFHTALHLALRSILWASLAFALCWLPFRVEAAGLKSISAGSALRTHVDRRVDAISDRDLRMLPPQSLVDPLRAQVAKDVAEVRRPLFFAWAFAQILFGSWLWRSGLSARIRDALQRLFRWPMAVRACYVASITLLNSIIVFPFDAIIYRKYVDLGVSHQSPASWCYDHALATGLQIALIVVMMVLILECVDRWRLWYLWSAALVFVGSGLLLVITPVVVIPLFHPTTALDSSTPLAHRLYAIEGRAGLGRIPIYMTALSRTTEVGNASVAGIGVFRRVLIGDTLVRTATPREVAFVMAHELGHEAHHDPLRLTLLSDILVILGGAVAVLIADRIPMRRDDDEVSRLPLVAALFGVCSLLLLPLGNQYSSHIESMADTFGLKVSQDGTAGARVFVRFADEGFAPLCPPRLVRWYFYDHPPLGSRIAKVTHRPDPCP